MRTVRTALAWLSAWWLPVVALFLLFGTRSVFVDEALFFSKTSCVTFGGAYAVLPYVAQRAVGEYHWLSPGEMLAGLGMAETTPGPLIQVLQFVGFLGAYRNPAGMNPGPRACSARSSRRGSRTCRASSGSSSAPRTSRRSAAVAR